MRRRDDKFPSNGFEAWGGYMQAKIAKLAEQFSVQAGKETLSNIFFGVSIYVNGYTIPSADELKSLMSQHGGVYHTYQRNEDFIIASNLPDTKVKNMSLGKVVRPEWITDSIANKQLLDYKDYLLYKTSRTQRQLNFKKVLKDENVMNEILEIENYIDRHDNLNYVKDEQKVSEGYQDVQDSISDNVTNPSTPFSTVINTNMIKIDLDPKLALKQNQIQITKTAIDPDFISEFYNNSRLHHISQLGACFKQYINDLRENSNFLYPARTELKNRICALNNSINSPQLKFEKNKIIMHIDMDCFFVSVGLRNWPHLRGKPVAVTHSKGGQGRPKRPGVDRSVEFNLYKQKQAKKLGGATKGKGQRGKSEDDMEFETRVDNIADEDDKYGSMSEIASCSYEARAKGVGNGMFMGAALRLCPDLHTIPYDFEGYKEVAYTLYNTIAQYTLDIEAVSCDEMYVDCTELLADLSVSAHDFATILRDEIRSKTECPCSTGFGGNRLQARLATKRAKPDGQFFLTEDLVEDFIFDIKLNDLPGVGRQTAYKLESLGHTTCGSLQTLTLATLKNHFGNKTGAQLFDQCRGRDLHPLQFHTVRKSVSAEVNYGIRFENIDQCYEFLKQLSAEVYSRMQQFKVLGKCITLKLMVRAEEAPIETAKFMGHGFCNVINKSSSFNNATNDVNIITKEAIALCKKQNIHPKEMRGVGIQITKLEAIKSKPAKGAINKFLSNKVVKTESKNKFPFLAKGSLQTIENQSSECGPVQQKPITPKKTINLSPKKSPTVLVKSPSGKRRGRPPRSLKLEQSSNNLMSKFLQGQNTIKDSPYKDPMVKEEIDLKNVALEEKPKGLLGLPWDKVRVLIRAWIESGQTPLACDINMIVAYLQDMVINKNTEKLLVLMNFLRRTTRDIGSDVWLGVYEHVLDKVQNAMIAVYGKKLFIYK